MQWKIGFITVDDVARRASKEPRMYFAAVENHGGVELDDACRAERQTDQLNSQDADARRTGSAADHDVCSFPRGYDSKGSSYSNHQEAGGSGAQALLACL